MNGYTLTLGGPGVQGSGTDERKVRGQIKYEEG
jgi:hypothetical protein